MSVNSLRSTWKGNDVALTVLQIFYGVFFVFGILKNAFVFYEINRKKVNRRFTTNQLLMAHLAAADILILLTLTPAIFYVEVDAKYTSYLACHVMFPMVLFYPYLRVFTQVVIAVERRRAISTPLKPRFAKGTIVLMLSMCWLLSAAFTAPVVWDATLGPLSCGDGRLRRLHRTVFYTRKAALQFVVPLIIISACYTQAGIVLGRSRILQIKRNEPVQHEASRVQNVRVCKAFAIMVAVFAVCTAPLNAICLWVEYGSGRYEAFENQAVYSFVAHFPVLFMSFLDPIIYGTCCLRRSLFRKAWRQILTWRNKVLSHITCSCIKT